MKHSKEVKRKSEKQTYPLADCERHSRGHRLFLPQEDSQSELIRFHAEREHICTKKYIYIHKRRNAKVDW